MPIYRIQDNNIVRMNETSFSEQKVKERDLQNMLKSHIDAISKGTLVVAEEFGDWEDSSRRIDLLGIDKNANLVVIELKRTEDGGHMELQALRYAAMISTITYDKLLEVYQAYINKNNLGIDAGERLLDFLGWEERQDDQFAQGVKIVLVSAEFSLELCTSVMWLNSFGLDIRCVRMHPYTSRDGVLLDIQTVIPLPEVADYQVRIREKEQKERTARLHAREYAVFEVEVKGEANRPLNSRKMIHRVVSLLIECGITPEEVTGVISDYKKNPFVWFKGEIDSDEFGKQLDLKSTDRRTRYFIQDSELFRISGNTYALSNQWTAENAFESARSLSKAFPDQDVKISRTS